MRPLPTASTTTGSISCGRPNTDTKFFAATSDFVLVRNAFPNAIIFHQVRNGEFDQITAAWLAVNGDVEQSQIA